MRHPLLCLLGLVCVMALAMFATTDALALTPVASADQSLATLAITPAPMPVTQFCINSTARSALFVLTASTAALPGTRTDTYVAWRSMPLKVSIPVALNSAVNSTAITDNNGMTARATPNVNAAALARNFPNHFNCSDTGISSVALHTTEITPTAMVTVDNSGRFNEMPGLVAMAGDLTQANVYQIKGYQQAA